MGGTTVPAIVLSMARLLDLFCGAGGASAGYHRAGFEVVGVDLELHSNYPFEFHRRDALEALADEDFIDDFDAIHASPPCQRYSDLNNTKSEDYPDLIPPVREALDRTGMLYVIENVDGAPLRFPAMICGAALGLRAHERDLDLSRHRLFETNWDLITPPCRCRKGRTIGVYGGGSNSGSRRRHDRDSTEAERREAMGIWWMNREQLAEAIPPAYTQLIGEQLLRELAHVGVNA
jgi:DNA (cytosine-5)-methyltransferase 1